MKVYLLWIAGEFESIFSSEELAKNYVENCSYHEYVKSRYYIKEVEVDEFV